MNYKGLILGLLTATLSMTSLTNVQQASALERSNNQISDRVNLKSDSTSLILAKKGKKDQATKKDQETKKEEEKKKGESKQVKWTLDETSAKEKDLTDVEKTKFNIFKNAVRSGLHPKQAADKMGDANYKKLLKNQYEIRLSQAGRATFTVDSKAHKVKILQVGGHT
jgi:murein DD-endopeptidase MepM/ murein hydrolase activator NlpD